MINASEIREHAEIIAHNGDHVGTVDRVEESRIKLTKNDNSTSHEGHHHFIELSAVESVEGDKVRLSVSREEAIRSEREKDGRFVQ